jgi:hypothetical protein
LCAFVGEEENRFRRRARECRDLAAFTDNEEWRATLSQLADELEEEADKVAAQEMPGPAGGTIAG